MLKEMGEDLRCVVLLPEGVDASRLARVDEGGIMDPLQSRHWLIGVIRSHLSQGGDRLAVVEDAVSRRGEAVLANLQSRVGFHDRDVYRVLGSADASEYAIDTTISESDSAHRLLCFLTHGDCGGDRKEDGSGQELSDGQLGALARRTEAVLAKEYDGEAFVLVRLT